MKQNYNVQLFAGSDHTISGNAISLEKFREPFYAPESYSPGKPGVSFFNQVIAVFPVKKMSSVETAVKPLFNAYLKLTASCLSSVEMALECYNVSDLQLSTQALTNLFFGMKMPAVYQLSVQMEEMAKEYQLEEVKVLLRAIKKIIGQIMKHSK
ncbi:MAG TPA: hypothetical protein VK483_17885 [Chitinophagaceae bacterium]|nr:hypothetical protein [Chitinophagaceae bacterium]